MRCGKQHTDVIYNIETEERNQSCIKTIVALFTNLLHSFSQRFKISVSVD